MNPKRPAKKVERVVLGVGQAWGRGSHGVDAKCGVHFGLIGLWNSNFHSHKSLKIKSIVGHKIRLVAEIIE